MNEVEQQKLAESPLQYTGDYPGRRRRRVVAWAIVVVVVVVLVLGSVAWVRTNNRVNHLETTVQAQSRQIHQLEAGINTQRASLAAAVACLEVAGSAQAQQGLCSKLVK